MLFLLSSSTTQPEPPVLFTALPPSPSIPEQVPPLPPVVPISTHNDPLPAALRAPPVSHNVLLQQPALIGQFPQARCSPKDPRSQQWRHQFSGFSTGAKPPYFPHLRLPCHSIFQIETHLCVLVYCCMLQQWQCEMWHPVSASFLHVICQ